MFGRSFYSPSSPVLVVKTQRKDNESSWVSKASVQYIDTEVFALTCCGPGVKDGGECVRI